MTLRRCFSGLERSPLRRSNFARRHFRPALERAGLPADVRFHDPRHTCVALLIDLGFQQYDVMRHLGHSSIKTTLDLYGQKFPNRDSEL